MRAGVMSVLVALSAVMAQAAGRQEASEVCTSMSFDSDRNYCISAISKYDYFDQGAINLCLGMSFDSGKKECISNIGNKTYDPYELTNCEKNDFDSSKNQCLKGAGRPIQGHVGCLNNQDIIFQLQILEGMVYRGENGRAR
ncbi:MAG TPA: hypothetical protein VIG33_13085, partial [Pseudobdellovibrionaceae bacterium]